MRGRERRIPEAEWDGSCPVCGGPCVDITEHQDPPDCRYLCIERGCGTWVVERRSKWWCPEP